MRIAVYRWVQRAAKKVPEPWAVQPAAYPLDPALAVAHRTITLTGVHMVIDLERAEQKAVPEAWVEGERGELPDGLALLPLWYDKPARRYLLGGQPLLTDPAIVHFTADSEAWASLSASSPA